MLLLWTSYVTSAVVAARLMFLLSRTAVEGFYTVDYSTLRSSLVSASDFMNVLASMDVTRCLFSRAASRPNFNFYLEQRIARLAYLSRADPCFGTTQYCRVPTFSLPLSPDLLQPVLCLLLAYENIVLALSNPLPDESALVLIGRTTRGERRVASFSCGSYIP